MEGGRKEEVGLGRGFGTLRDGNTNVRTSERMGPGGRQPGREPFLVCRREEDFLDEGSFPFSLPTAEGGREGERAGEREREREKGEE